MLARFIAFVFSFGCVRLLVGACMESWKEFTSTKDLRIANDILSKLASGDSVHYWYVRGRQRRGVRNIVREHAYRVLLPFAQDGNICFLKMALVNIYEKIPISDEQKWELLQIAGRNCDSLQFAYSLTKEIYWADGNGDYVPPEVDIFFRQLAKDREEVLD